MSLEDFKKKLPELNNSSVLISESNIYEGVVPSVACVMIDFSQGAKLRVDYWRVIKSGRHFLSSFDHNQQYGLPAPINAIAEIKKELHGKKVVEVKFEKETGDLLFIFEDDLKLEALNFTGYEVWEISFPDGTTVLSNYAREYD